MTSSAKRWLCTTGVLNQFAGSCEYDQAMCFVDKGREGKHDITADIDKYIQVAG